MISLGSPGVISLGSLGEDQHLLEPQIICETILEVTVR